jgi:hypothetical protein
METPLGTVLRVNLQASVDGQNEDGKPVYIGETDAKLQENNGVFLQGGVTNISRQDSTYPDQDFVYTCVNGIIVGFKFGIGGGFQILNGNNLFPAFSLNEFYPNIRDLAINFIRSPSGQPFTVVYDVKMDGPNKYYILAKTELDPISLYVFDYTGFATLLFSTGVNALTTNNIPDLWCISVTNAAPVYVVRRQASNASNTNSTIIAYNGTTSQTKLTNQPTDVVRTISARNNGANLVIVMTARTANNEPTSNLNCLITTFTGSTTRHLGSFMETRRTIFNSGTFADLLITWEPREGVDTNVAAWINIDYTAYTAISGPGGTALSGGYAGPGFSYFRMNTATPGQTRGYLTTPGYEGTGTEKTVIFNPAVNTIPNFSFEGFRDYAFSDNNVVRKYVIQGVLSNAIGDPLYSANPDTGAPNGGKYANRRDELKNCNETIYELKSGIVRYGFFFIDTNRGSFLAYNPEPSFYTYPAGTYTLATGATRFVSIENDLEYINSFDTGEVVLDYVFTPQPGSGLNVAVTTGDVYLNGVYSFTGGNVKRVGSKIDTLYIPLENIPLTKDENIGEISFYRQEDNQTVIRSRDFHGYKLQNVVAGNLQAFQMLGTLYFYDGTWILTAPTQGFDLTGGVQRVLQLTGMRFICSAPDCALFHSNYDNSVFVFDGGRSVKKLFSMEKYTPISIGVFNAEEDSFCLLSGTITNFQTLTAIRKIYIIRSGVLYIRKDIGPYSAIGEGGLVKLYPTIDSTVYAVGNKTTRDFFNIGGGNVYPLELKTPFYSAAPNTWLKVSQIVIVYRPRSGSSPNNFTFVYSYFDAEGVAGSQTVTKSFSSSSGQRRIVFRPTVDSVSSFSFKITAQEKVVIYDILVYYSTQGPIQVSNNYIAP